MVQVADLNLKTQFWQSQSLQKAMFLNVLNPEPENSDIGVKKIICNDFAISAERCSPAWGGLAVALSVSAQGLVPFH